MTKLVATMPGRAINGLWWLYMIEAILALFFGIAAVFWPGLTLVTLVYLFGAFILGVGIVQLISGLMSIRSRSNWWVSMLMGLLGVALGIYLVRHPGVSFHTFVLLIGLILLARGLLDLVRAFTDHGGTYSSTPRVLNAILGIAGILAGIFIMIQPVTGGVAFVWILGVYAIIIGVLHIAIAIELRSALQDMEVSGPYTAALEVGEEEAQGEIVQTRTRKKAGAGRK